MKGPMAFWKPIACILIMWAAASCSTAKQGLIDNPFPEATEVRLFVESGKRDAEGDVIWTLPEGRVLTPEQRTRFEATLSVVPVPDEMAACFIPHHYFRYYDSAGNQVGEVSACFCCSGVSIDPYDQIRMGPDQMLDIDIEKLGDLVRSMGEPTDIEC